MLLKTQRLVLREFVEQDWKAVLAYRNRAEYHRYYPGTAETEADARGFVNRMIEDQLQQPRRMHQLAITLPESGKLIGNVGLRLRGIGPRQPEAVQGDIGYELDPDYWRQGYASEAAQAMLMFGFESLGLHRIWAYCLSENRGSRGVLEKVGMRLEGVLREDEYFKGRWWDTAIYAIIDSEWAARTAAASKNG